MSSKKVSPTPRKSTPTTNAQRRVTNAASAGAARARRRERRDRDDGYGHSHFAGLPAAVASAVEQHAPPRRVVRRRELLRVIRESEGLDDLPNTVFVNPGLTEFSPWLATQARLYLHYRIRKLRFEYLPTCPTTLGGALTFGFTPNPMVEAPSTDQGMFLEANATSMSVSTPGEIDCSTVVRKPLLTRTIDIDYDTQPLYDAGALHWINPKAEPWSTGHTLGQLFVDYEVELWDANPGLALEPMVQRDEGWSWNTTRTQDDLAECVFPGGAVQQGSAESDRMANYWATGETPFIEELEHATFVDPNDMARVCAVVKDTCIQSGDYQMAALGTFNKAWSGLPDGTGFDILDQGLDLFAYTDADAGIEEGIELPSLNYCERGQSAIYKPGTMGTIVSKGTATDLPVGRQAHYILDTETAVALGVHHKYVEAGMEPLLRRNDEILRLAKEGTLTMEALAKHRKSLSSVPAFVGQVFRWIPEATKWMLPVANFVRVMAESMTTEIVPVESSAEVRRILRSKGLSKRPTRPTHLASDGMVLKHPVRDKLASKVKAITGPPPNSDDNQDRSKGGYVYTKPAN